jgi:hypothetical protein
MEEKRCDPRFRVSGECAMKVLFSRRDPRAIRTRKVRAQVKNVSQGGVCLVTREPFQEGDLADCVISLGDGASASSLGLVKWHTPGRGVGIEFFYGSDAERDFVRTEVKDALGSP